ncbi:MAG TPA: MraY family glycosyltransferase [Rhodanobacter sp.]|nr:MraY family glycosyltransferase [Rhodanobacter sp.]
MTFELRILDACALATSVSAVSLLLLLPLSRRLGLVDHPDPFRKRHAFDTPLVGGLAIAVGMLAGWWCLGTPSKFEDAVVCTALMLVVVGVADDLFNLRVSVRVIAQLSAIAIVVISSGVYIHSLGILHGHELTLGWLGIPFTVIAVIGLLNAFNLIDGMDGLAGCLTLVAAGSIEFLSNRHGATMQLASVAVIAAAVLPYLAANLGLLGPRGKVFLGDAGSVMLGYLLAWTLIGMSQSVPRQISPGLVLWCVALPVFDTLTVMFRRMHRGESPFTADRGHIHHLLVDVGLKPRDALLCLVAFAAVLPVLGYVIHQSAGAVANALAFAALLVMYAVFTARLGRRLEERRLLSQAVSEMLVGMHAPARNPARIRRRFGQRGSLDAKNLTQRETDLPT